VSHPENNSDCSCWWSFPTVDFLLITTVFFTFTSHPQKRSNQPSPAISICWAPLTHATHGTDISTYMCLTFTVNVGKYTIHRCYGSGLPVYLHKPDQLDIRFQPVHWTWRTIRAFNRIKPRQKTDLPVLTSKNWTMKFFHWEINIEPAIDYLHQLNWGIYLLVNSY